MHFTKFDNSFLNFILNVYSLFLNFFSQYPIPLYKRRKMSGQSPLRVARGLRYLIFHFMKEFWKSFHLVDLISVRGLLIDHKIGEKCRKIYYNLLSYWKLIKGLRIMLKKRFRIEDNILKNQLFLVPERNSIRGFLKNLLHIIYLGSSVPNCRSSPHWLSSLNQWQLSTVDSARPITD